MECSNRFLAKMNDELKDEHVGRLDQQFRDIISNTSLLPEEALLVMMESMLTLFPETDSHHFDMKFSDADGCHYSFTLEIKTPVVFEREN
jgi:hypothetical protein